MFNGARILVAPLDWGLGHATRDVPIVRRLLERDARPVIGADKGPLALLRDEFPDLPCVRIPGVEVRYSSGGDQLWSMARQFPAMVASVRRERSLFDRLKDELKLDAVISDQRFGIRSPELPCVLITHQVFPFTPFAQAALRKLNLHHLSRFDRCWIMDDAAAPGLAGELSHGRDMPRNACYIGIASRMQPVAVARRYRIAAVISGPEPQRTILENILIDQLPAIQGEHLLVRGKPGSHDVKMAGRLTVVPHLAGAALAEALCSAELIVSRSGYTTLMDLVALRRTALVIPTPGQTEQEYLGRLHAASGRFLVQAQDRVDLHTALRTIGAGQVNDPMDRSPSAGPFERALEELATLIHR